MLPAQYKVCEVVAFGVGNGLTVTLTLVAGPLHPAVDVTYTAYTPLMMGVAFVIEGFCDVEEKPFGPDQL